MEPFTTTFPRNHSLDKETGEFKYDPYSADESYHSFMHGGPMSIMLDKMRLFLHAEERPQWCQNDRYEIKLRQSLTEAMEKHAVYGLISASQGFYNFRFFYTENEYRVFLDKWPVEGEDSAQEAFYQWTMYPRALFDELEEGLIDRGTPRFVYTQYRPDDADLKCDSHKSTIDFDEHNSDEYKLVIFLHFQTCDPFFMDRTITFKRDPELCPADFKNPIGAFKKIPYDICKTPLTRKDEDGAQIVRLEDWDRYEYFRDFIEMIFEVIPQIEAIDQVVILLHSLEQADLGLEEEDPLMVMSRTKFDRHDC